ncbi:fungal-specific transcription factor domain-containing protein [Bisporella sp. PMI_857]|nr:fungal-specific transcription factor domain-containing protein [Bisporella sp. PMI_857]
MDDIADSGLPVTMDANARPGASNVDSGSGGEGLSRPQQKRRKISTACEPCRARKVRCDGNRPVCEPCRQRSNSQSCLYKKDPPKSDEAPRESTKSLTDRIQSIERILANQQSTREHGNRQPTQNADQSPTSEIISLDAESETSPVNAMGSTAYIDNENASPSANQFFGGSSVAHFMHEVNQTIHGTDQRRPHEKHLPSVSFAPRSSPLARYNSSETASISRNYPSLPQRDLADKLLENYWIKAHTLYPFLHKPSFNTAYENLWKSSNDIQQTTTDCDLGLGTPSVSDSRSTVFHCALNAIFALSCQLSGQEILQHGRESLSQTFFLRSKSLLHVDILDHGSIALVQTLLIITQFLQSSSSPGRCWNSLGLACRIAQGLGIHIEDRFIQREPCEIELRRRVWYGCVTLDIVTSTTLGRPMMTPCEIIIPLPSVTPEDESVLHQGNTLSYLTFYIETIKLYLILGRIISAIYKPWSVQGTNADARLNTTINTRVSDLEAIVSLDAELSTFEGSIAFYLHWERRRSMRDDLTEVSEWIIRRQGNVLHARYMHVRVLLHRLTFQRLCRQTGPLQQAHQLAEKTSNIERSLQYKIDIQSVAACVDASVDLINLLHNSVSTTTDGAWWYTTYYLYTAAMVLILAESCFRTNHFFDHGEVHAAWLLGCETLRMLGKRGYAVEHALNTLSNIYQRLVSNKCAVESGTRNQNPSSETASSDTEQARQSAYTALPHGRDVSNFSSQPFQEQSESHFIDSGQLDGMDMAPIEPLMNLMTQDMSSMPFGLMDEDWWRMRYGDYSLDSGI